MGRFETYISKYRTPRFVFVVMTGLVFLAEMFIMYFINNWLNFSMLVEALVDASLLALIGGSLSYIVLFRPMLLPINERKRAQAELQKAYAELEVRVEERTTDLAKANEDLQTEINERKRTQEELKRKHQTQHAINSMLSTSVKDYSLEEILERIIEQIVSVPWLLLGAKGLIFLVEDNPNELVMKACWDVPLEIKNMCAKVPFGRCICGRAASSNAVQFVNVIDSRHENVYEGMNPHGHYCVPIQSPGKLLGVLNLYVKEGHRHNQEEEDFLSEVAANVLAGVIERKQAELELDKHRHSLEELVKERSAQVIQANEDLRDDIVKREQVEKQLQQSVKNLRKSMGGIIQAMALTLERRDPYTAGHQRRMTDLARAIGTEMGLLEDQLDGIRMAGTIHDLGKISVPAEILTKPGTLTKTEFNLIQTHSQVGYDILITIDFPWPLAQIVFQHHERVDGSGYPLGLKGDEILLEAKILAVADVVEAIASHRPYRPALGVKEALSEIAQNKGTLYDPDVVDACLELFNKKGYKLQSPKEQYTAPARKS